ncbi:ribonuclease HI [Candidatus Cytomitobacter indipagum]|uniref:Ribonuclease H n=1 Tax=Candidatus Cytomitobacter indipagum TaxID=2601575 RepID=A0A5C0UEX6_9PROT|nr:ribonuclease HI [Candidatus Cytomitobacter indipagum]QEK38241.1 ribonuclease HI [Candidatus Cytomitobacter indipagum]
MTWHLITDGSCLGNPGRGGWAFMLQNGENKDIHSGYEEKTTNNRMELQALISGLKYFSQQSKESLDVTMDSQYVINGVKSWMANWKRNNWQTAAKTPVKNKDLWMELDKIIPSMSLNFIWTKGHQDHELHNIVDEAARCAADKHASCTCK